MIFHSLQNVIEHALGEESAKLLLGKGKNKIGDDEEVFLLLYEFSDMEYEGFKSPFKTKRGEKYD